MRVPLNAHHSLMTVVSDRLGIPGFGLCNGMGSCGTCMVRISRHAQQHGYIAQSCKVSVDQALEGSCIIVEGDFI